MTRAVRVVASLAIFCLTMEALGLAYFYWDTGRLFYGYRRPVDPIYEARDTLVVGAALHPYFGFTHKAGQAFDIPTGLAPSPSLPRMATNNFGFIGTSDYPTARANDRQFFIGIFGGSVGVWFCAVGVPSLLEELRQHPSLRERELVPLCFSHEGYKQPQQLQVLSYFLSLGQPLDLAINIDGFNEVALSSINAERGLDISMPSAPHLEPLINLTNRFTMTPEKLQSLASIARDRARLARLGDLLASNYSAGVDLVLFNYSNAVRRRYERERVTFDQLPSNPSPSSVVAVAPHPAGHQPGGLHERVARNWARASILMRDLLATRGVPYVHVLQPNQYFTTRRFDEDEAKVALNPASPFKKAAEQGYPALLGDETTAMLKGNGIRFIDATKIFDDAPEPVYIDDCCHYTSLGYQLLARSISREIARPDGLQIQPAAR
jgi:hypothetical protein